MKESVKKERKRCILCGAELESSHWNAKYCGKCKKELRRERQRAYNKEHRQSERRADLGPARRVKRPYCGMSVEQLAIAARQAGMSYGRYVATRGQ